MPAIQISFAENQSLVASNLESAGAALSIDQDFEADRLAAALSKICGPRTYASMSLAAQGICDGHGARRLCELLDQIS